MKGLITWSQRAAINKLKALLVKLNIKSAKPPEPITLTTGSRAILKINGKPVAFAQGVSYDFNNTSDLTSDGSDD